MHIVIPAAGIGHRMKSAGPKALLDIHGEALILRQIKILSHLYPAAEITVVVGFHADKVRAVLPKKVRTVTNKNFVRTNVSWSLGLAISTLSRSCSEVLIVYGDLVFNRATMASLKTEGGSAVLVGGGRRHDIGVTVCDGEATHFSHGLTDKWAQVAYLRGLEKELFERYTTDPANAHRFTYEIFNVILRQHSTSLQANHLSKHSRLMEIDRSTDLEKSLAVS